MFFHIKPREGEIERNGGWEESEKKRDIRLRKGVKKKKKVRDKQKRQKKKNAV